MYGKSWTLVVLYSHFFEMFGVVYAIFKCYQSISRLVYGCQDWAITKVQFEKLDGGVTCVEITRLGNLT